MRVAGGGGQKTRIETDISTDAARRFVRGPFRPRGFAPVGGALGVSFRLSLRSLSGFVAVARFLPPPPLATSRVPGVAVCRRPVSAPFLSPLLRQEN
ncbi:MAG: hypothetical protein R3F44_16635 [Candidatus Competibacteraceae bacterium]